MNHKLDELFEQAGGSFGNDGEPILPDIEVFAELIVKDITEYLIDMANNLYNDDRGAEVALLYEAKELKKRYGVKG